MAAMTRREFVKHATTDLAVAECLAARAARADLTKESVAFLKTLKA